MIERALSAAFRRLEGFHDCEFNSNVVCESSEKLYPSPRPSARISAFALNLGVYVSRSQNDSRAALHLITLSIPLSYIDS